MTDFSDREVAIVRRHIVSRKGASTRSSRLDGDSLDGATTAWRLRVYEGEYWKHGEVLLLMEEVTRDLSMELGESDSGAEAQECMLALVTDLRARSNRRYPIAPFAETSTFLTVFVELLRSAGDVVGQPVARLDMVREKNRFSAGLLVAGQPRIDVEAVDFEASDGVLDVLLKMLSHMLS
ncbi:hypothetical protein LJR034_005427 [Caballeronia sp. LjRoot34]|uniref:hypothetical protein n=1 Tax=Caballeronia sp. LjRoot34 TaxID=3342325 RepID=UPI003ED0A35E